VLFSLMALPAEALADAANDASAGAPATELAPDILEAQGAVIGDIIISNGNVFDLDNPEEDKWLYRLANRIHVKTRPNVIRQQLLFQPGDQVSSRLLYESERILRANRYIQEASIRPISIEDGITEIGVTTWDTWTLTPDVSFGRKGGKSSGGFGVHERNLLGTGVQIGASYKTNVDRNSRSVSYFDNHLGDSWYSLSALYADNSDGYTQQFSIDKPFYALDSTDSRGFSLGANDQIESLYERGEILADYRHQTRSHELHIGWSEGLSAGWARRYTAGVVYDDHAFSPVEGSTAPITVVPENRKLVYPYIGIEFMQDEFEKTENVDQINRTEDRYLGTHLSARLGYSSTGIGADRNAWLIGARVSTGFGNFESNSLLLASDLNSRWASDGLHNLAVRASARFYKRQSERRLFYTSLSGVYGHNLDIDNQLYLGGDNGLRGYPLRYQGGDKSVLFTAEQRYFTDWFPFRLFRVGGAIFFDAGRTWGSNAVNSESLGLLKDIGIGLRFGNTRIGVNDIIHVDLAFPLDGDDSIKNVQLLIETKRGF
jgi:outer membrane protein assembly factor BamA